ncbi:MAG: serine/threonine protein kinase, partial [Xanthomonadales bacterium]|nr:serine/threonine protein kinase [Xanthomonadales bacterium]
SGIIHRDLKPGNVLLAQRDGRLHPWVLDFGLARGPDDATLTVEGQILGTPGYLSPEQAQGLPADTRADVYSLGVMLFEALTGRLPHTADGATGHLLATVALDAPAVNQLDPSLPSALARVVQQCLERNPADRYADAGALRQDLDALLAGQRVQARSVGAWYRWRRRLRRSPWLSASAALLLLLLLSGGWSAWRQAQATRAAAEQGRQLEQRVAGIERELQLIHTQPTSDIRAAVATVSSQALDEAESLARVSTGAIAASAQAAAGRIYLAIGDPQAAIEPLERAWYAGLQDPQLGAMLGQAHAAAYLDALALAQRQQDPVARAEALQAAEQEHGEPARRFLQQSVESEPMARALLARLEGDLPGALRALEIQTHSTWPIPPWLLALRLRLEHATRLLDEGATDALQAELANIAPLLQKLVDRVRSHPEAWQLGCRSDALAVALSGLRSAATTPELSHCDGLERIDPDALPHRLAGAEAWSRLARLQLQRGEDPRAAISRGLSWLERPGLSEPAPAQNARWLGLRGGLLLLQANHQQQVLGKRATEQWPP